MTSLLSSVEAGSGVDSAAAVEVFIRFVECSGPFVSVEGDLRLREVLAFGCVFLDDTPDCLGLGSLRVVAKSSRCLCAVLLRVDTMVL